MSPRTRAIAIASVLLAVGISAQSVPADCANAANLIQTCIPTDAGATFDATVINCLCSDGTLDADVRSCLQKYGSQLPKDAQQALSEFQGFCATEATGGGSDPSATGSEDTPTSTSGFDDSTTATPEPSGSDDSVYCSALASDLKVCQTDDNVEPTAAPVATCLCGGSADISFDDLVESCYSYLATAAPSIAPTIAAYGGYCSSYYDGGSGSGFDTASPTGAVFTSAPQTSVPRVLTTPTPTPSSAGSGSGTGTGTIRQSTNPSATNNNGPPAATTTGAASAVKVTYGGLAAAAVFVGFAALL